MVELPPPPLLLLLAILLLICGGNWNRLAPLAYLGLCNSNGLNELKNEYVELNKPGVCLAKNGDVYVTIGVCNDCANDKLLRVGLFGIAHIGGGLCLDFPPLPLLLVLLPPPFDDKLDADDGEFVIITSCLILFINVVVDDDDDDTFDGDDVISFNLSLLLPLFAIAIDSIDEHEPGFLSESRSDNDDADDAEECADWLRFTGEQSFDRFEYTSVNDGDGERIDNGDGDDADADDEMLDGEDCIFKL